MRLASALLLALLVPLAAAAPTQVHLGLTDDPSTTRSVLWVEDAPVADPAVVLTTQEGERTIPAQRVDGPGAGIVYEARIDGLAPGTTYPYRVGERSFQLTTAPARDAPVRFVALGDMGVTDASRATFAAIQSIAPDFVLHAGDISYGEGNPVTWKAWFDLVEPYAAQRPWIPALGNHETYSGAGVNGFVGVPSPVEVAFYEQRFGLPGNEIWYSFDWGPVHVIALDTFSGVDIADEQIAWLEQDLAEHADAPWTLAFLHEPPYSSNTNHGSSARVQEAFVALFEKHGVDVVIAAHDHFYERTHPMRGGERAEDGVVYVVTGGAGQSLYTGLEEPAPAWSAARSANYHVTAFEATATRLAWRVVATDGSTFTDSYELTKPDTSGTLPGALADKATAAPGLLALVAVAAGLAVARRRR